LGATVPSGRAILRARAHLDAGRARVPSIDRSNDRCSTIDDRRSIDLERVDVDARGRGTDSH